MKEYVGNLAHIAEEVRQQGRAGDDILIHVNPEEFAQMQEMWGEPSFNPMTGLPEYGLFSKLKKKLKKALKFEAFNVKNIVKGALKNPEQLLFGIDPLGTKIGNTVMGTDNKALVNQLGGATEDMYRAAEAKGIDTGLARDLHNAAGLVAGFYGAQGLGNLASAGLGSMGGGSASGLNPSAWSGDALSQAAIEATATPGSTAAAGLNPAAWSGDALSQAAIDATSGAGQGGGSTLGNLGSKAAEWGGKAWDYAKQPANWPTILQGVQTVGNIVGQMAGPDEPSGPPAADPGYSLNIQHPQRSFLGNVEDYYNYGEGPEHSYYSYGPLPEPVWRGDDPNPPQVGLAGGGDVPDHYLSGLGSPLSKEARYMEGGPGGGQDDQIEALLSPKEYVFDATTVAMLGDGNPDWGAKKLDEMRRKIWKDRGKHYTKGKLAPKAKDPEEYM